MTESAGARPIADTTTDSADRLSVWTKFSFGIGSTADTVMNSCVGAYAMLFYNQVVGLPAGLAGLAVSVGLIFDGLSDPLAGSLSDRTRSRLGRRHFWLYLAPIPIALAFIAVFNPPRGMSDMATFIWFLVSVSTLRWCLTFYQVPHLALGGELSRDYAERSRVMSFHTFFAWAGTAVAGWVALTFFFRATPEYPRGLLNPDAYGPFSLAAAAFAVIFMVASGWFTRDRVPYMPKVPEHLPKFSPYEFIGDIGKMFRNPNYVWMIVALLFVALMQGLRNTLGIYTNTYFWGLTSEQIRWFVIGSGSGYLIGFLFSTRLHRRFDKMAILLFSAGVYAVGPAIPIALGLLGVLSPETPGFLGILIAFSTLGFGGGAVLYISTLSILADIADENELKFGLRQEGMLYSTRTLFQKVDQAIGAALAGWVLTLINFPERANPGEVAMEVVRQIALWDGILATIPGAVAVYFYSRCRTNRGSYETTRAALAERAKG